MKIKLILGFRKDQQHSISIEEAHKAYYLFLNPSARSIFNTGLALKGSDIQAIVPDYQGSMGWNPEHPIDEYDMAEIRQKGVDTKLRDLMYLAKDTAYSCKNTELNTPLTDLLENKAPLKLS